MEAVLGVFGKCSGGGRRSAVRRTAPLIAILSTLTENHTAVLIDVSETGVRVRGDDLPLEGDELIITIEGVRSFGTVSWTMDGECGIAFDAPLPARDVAVLCQKAATGRGISPEARAAFEDWTLGLAR